MTEVVFGGGGSGRGKGSLSREGNARPRTAIVIEEGQAEGGAD